MLGKLLCALGLHRPPAEGRREFFYPCTREGCTASAEGKKR